MIQSPRIFCCHPPLVVALFSVPEKLALKDISTATSQYLLLEDISQLTIKQNCFTLERQ